MSRDVINSDERLTITDVALAEAAHVLRSVYAIEREAVIDSLVSLINRENIGIYGLHKTTVIEGLLFCRSSNRVSVPDALIWAAARDEGGATIYTMDRRFPRDGVMLKRLP